MEAKKKAQELIEKFIPYNQEYEEGTDMHFHDNIEGAKECALTCVNEIIELLQFDLGHDATSQGLLKEYEEIKAELKKQS